MNEMSPARARVKAIDEREVFIEITDLAIRHRLPELQCLLSRRPCLSVIKHDDETTLWRVATEAGDGSGVCVVRVFNHPQALGQATREATVMNWASARGVSLPRVLHLSTGHPRLPRPYLVLEWVAGAPAGHEMREDGADRESLCRRLGTALAELHRLPVCDEVATRCLPRHDGIGETVAEFEAAIKRAGLDADFAHPFARLRTMAAAAPVATVCFVHGDFHPGNVMLAADGRLVIVDWTMAGWRDHRFDLAWAALQLGPAVDDAGRCAFLDAYGHASGCTRSLPPFFEAFACLRALATAAGIGQRGPRREMPAHLRFREAVGRRWHTLAGVESPRIGR